MKASSIATAAFALLVSASVAQAHFVWLAIEKKDSNGQATVQVYFSEAAEPDSADLLDKITTVKVWGRSADGKPLPVAVTKTEKDGNGALVGAAADAKTISAHIKYGVLTRGENKFLLQYYAKYLDAAALGSKALTRDESLALDIVPRADEKGCECELLFQGKPAAEADVVISGPVAAEVKTDAAGRFTVDTSKPGLYSIRAKWVVKEAGKDGDKDYPQVNNYCTLALRVPAAAAKLGATTPTSVSLTAGDLMQRAHNSRAVWQNFTGFEADLALYTEGRQQKGRVKVAADGQVTLSGLELKDEKEVVSTLRSLVGHRMPGGDSDDRVSFSDQQTDHPLGRLIKLDHDSAMASTYRIKDDVIREVNRQSESGRFTISVFEVNRNPEGKYLPGYYTVSYWNKDGSLRSASVVRESWVRVGSFDLPATRDGVLTGANERSNVSMVFSNHKLLK